MSQNSSGGQQPWERASLATLAEEFSRAAEYEDHTGFDNVMGQRQRFSGFLHDLLSRAKQASARDQATYKAVAALAAEAQQYEALRVPERALLLVRPVLPRPCPVPLTCASRAPPASTRPAARSALELATGAACRCPRCGAARARSSSGGVRRVGFRLGVAHLPRSPAQLQPLLPPRHPRRSRLAGRL